MSHIVERDTESGPNQQQIVGKYVRANIVRMPCFEREAASAEISHFFLDHPNHLLFRCVSCSNCPSEFSSLTHRRPQSEVERLTGELGASAEATARARAELAALQAEHAAESKVGVIICSAFVFGVLRVIDSWHARAWRQLPPGFWPQRRI